MIRKEINTDKIMLALFNQGILTEDVDYIVSDKSEGKETTTLLLEEPVYVDFKGWYILNKYITVKEDGTFFESKGNLSERYSFSDLAEKEYLEKKIYNFIKSEDLLYIEKKQPIIKEDRYLETTKIILEKGNIKNINKWTNPLSRTPEAITYKEPFSRPYFNRGYGDTGTNYDFYEDDNKLCL